MGGPASWKASDAKICADLREAMSGALKDESVTPAGGWRYGDSIIVQARLEPDGWSVQVQAR